MGNLNFDAESVDPAGSYDPLPQGWYAMTIVAADLVTGQSADAGEMLRITFEIQNAESHNGRQVTTWLCHNHKKQMTRDIARRQLSSIAHSIKLLQLEDTSELLGESLMVRLKVRPSRGDYGPSNEATGFAALGERKPMEAPADTEKGTGNASPSKASAPSWK